MKKIIKNNLHIKILLTAIIGILVSFGVTTLAKYITEDFHGYYLNSKHFFISGFPRIIVFGLISFSYFL